MLNDADDQRKMLEKGIDSVPQMNELVNRALISYIKVVAESRRASDLAAYAKHPKIIPRFGMAYRVNMSFGLHVGWSIEGAIGSEHKIDASYLSPHVNIASRLESITKSYGVDIIVSENFFGYLCTKARDRCRRIDVAKLKGTGAPMSLYCFDINKDEVPMPPDGAMHVMSSVIPPAEMTMPELLTKGVEALFQYDQDVVALQTGVTEAFMNYWETAFNYYLQGNWSTARDLLDRFSSQYPLFDGPTQTLLQHILACESEPPSDWAGYRILRVK
jgi:hypothetical protein